MSTVVSLIAGMAFGLALAAPPGPMNAVIAEESVLRGWGAGFRAGLGAAIADFCFFLLALVGVVAFVRRSELVTGAMVGIGGLLMLYFAYGAVADARETFTGEAVADGEGSGESRGFRKAFVLALTNPYQVVFWLTVGVGLLEPGSLDALAPLADSLAGLVVVETGSPALIVGLFGGIAVWITGFPAALMAAERRVNRLGPAVAVLSGIVLAGFGVYYLFRAGRTLAGL